MAAIEVLPEEHQFRIAKLLRAEGVYSVTQFDNVKEYLSKYSTPDVVASMGSVL